VIFARSYIG